VNVPLREGDSPCVSVLYALLESHKVEARKISEWTGTDWAARRVQTPLGPGALWQVMVDMVGVVLVRNKERVVYFDPL
jgi:hypothetical protein